jgi:carboxypeptidase PM20D1
MPPRQGAIGVLAAALGRLEADPFPAHLDHAGRFFERVGPRMSFGRRVLFANLWLFGPLVEQLLAGNPPMNAVMRSTVAPTIVRGGDKDNVLPIEAEAIVNHRIIPGETIESVLVRDRAVIADPRVELERSDSEFGSEPSPVSSWTSPAFLAMAESVRAVAQDPELIVVPYLVLGATDSRYFTDLADDVYRFMFNWMGPDDLPRIHGTDERIAVAQYANTVRFYSALLRRLAGPATPSP